MRDDRCDCNACIIVNMLDQSQRTEGGTVEKAMYGLCVTYNGATWHKLGCFGKCGSESLGGRKQ
jgi:hypothetical protein